MCFFRHFEAQNNLPGRKLHYNDAGLTERGIAQGRVTARHVATHGLSVFLCSPAARARQSVVVINAALAVPIPVIICQGLDELHWGSSIAGKSINDMFTPTVESKADREGIHFRLDEHDGESMAEVHARVYAAIEPYRDYPVADVGVMTHGTPQKSLFGVELHMTRRQMIQYPIANGEVHGFDINNPRPPTRLFVPEI